MPDPSGYVIPDAIDIPSQATVANPPANTRRLYYDSGTGLLSVRTSAGTTVSLENTTNSAIILQEDDANVNTGTETLDFTEPDATLLSTSGAEVDVNMALYALLLGRSSPQIISGGTGINTTLKLRGSSNVGSTTASVEISNSYLQLASGYAILDSGSNARILLGTSTPHISLTGDIKMVTAATSILDSGGTARFTPATSSPHVVLTGSTHATVNLGVGTTAPSASSTVEISPVLGSLSSSYNIINMSGATVTIGAGSLSMSAVNGVLTATVPDATTLSNLKGLQFTATAQTTAASATGTVTTITGLNITAGSLAIGSGRTLNVTEQYAVKAAISSVESSSGTVVVTTAYVYSAATPTTTGNPAITTYYAYHANANSDTDITNRLQFYEAGCGTTTADNHGNRFASNTQFGSITGAFGTAQGVIGITDATTAPSTNAAGGGVLYSEGGALKWRGTAGTVTTIATS